MLVSINFLIILTTLILTHFFNIYSKTNMYFTQYESEYGKECVKISFTSLNNVDIYTGAEPPPS